MPVGHNTPDTRSDGASDESVGGQTRRLTIPLETLSVLNWLGDTAMDSVEDRLNQVIESDLTLETEQVTVGYTERETVSRQFGAADRAGARVRVNQPLKGNALIGFPMESANKMAALMLQRAVDDLSSVSTEMGRDALTELCNMMVNAFVDEWATLFETPIDTDSPIAVHAPEQTLVQRIVKHYEMGMYITSHLRIPDYNIEGTIYVFPGDEQFVTKISQVGLEVIQ